MKLVRLDSLFEIKYGSNLKLNALTQVENGINFVSRTSQNNGVSAKVEKLKNLSPIPAGVLTVAGGGSVLETFLQSEPFYSGHDLYYLVAKIFMSDAQKLYYVKCIRSNRYKYNYGRQANKTLKTLLVPSFDDLPSWVRNVSTDLDKGIGSSVSGQLPTKLLVDQWSEYQYHDLFDIKGSKTTTLKKLVEYGAGEYPYVTTAATNNGVAGFYNFYTENGNCLVIDSAVTGYCSYQENFFSASDHVEKLIPKFKLNKYVAMFLVTIINNERYRYNYGRKSSQSRIKEKSIRLPATILGKPDWNFMENYIKSLPYSSQI